MPLEMRGHFFGSFIEGYIVQVEPAFHYLPESKISLSRRANIFTRLFARIMPK